MRHEIEFDDKGELVGEAPEPLKAIFGRIETTAHGAGFGKGAAKAAEEAKKQIADTVAAEVAKREALLPIERAKWAEIDETNKSLQTKLIESDRAHDRILKDREEAHAREILSRKDAIEKREARVKELVRGQLRAEARAHGARDESASELDLVLSAWIGYDDDMTPYVKNSPDDPAQKLVHGKPQGIGAFVKEYLDTHPHHKRPTSTAGGGARGGASQHGAHPPASLDQARARIEGGDRSVDAVDAMYQALKKQRAS